MKNLSVANGSYTAQDGSQKTRWVNIGKIMEKDGKEFILIDPTVNFAAFPREQGRDMVMVGIFEENNNQQQQNNNQGYNNQNVQYEDNKGNNVNQQQYNQNNNQNHNMQR